MKSSLLWFSFPGTASNESLVLMGNLNHRFRIRQLDFTKGSPSTFSPTEPAVIVLDITDSTHNVFELIWKFRLAAPSVPVLCLALQDSTETSSLALKAGAMEYIIKPIQPKELEDRICNCLEFLYQLKEANPPSLPFSPPMTHKLHRVIEKNYHRKITLEELARKFSMTTFQLCRYFKRETGQSFKEYLIRYRLQQAMKKLAGTSDSITEIAINAGFNDLSNFQRLFRKKIGITPRDYRKAKQYPAMQKSPLILQEYPRRSGP